MLFGIITFYYNVTVAQTLPFTFAKKIINITRAKVFNYIKVTEKISQKNYIQTSNRKIGKKYFSIMLTTWCINIIQSP